MRSNKNKAVIGTGIAGIRISFQLKDQGYEILMAIKKDQITINIS